MRWVVGRRSPEWVLAMIRSLPEVAEAMPDFSFEITSAEDKAFVAKNLRTALRGFPEILDEGRNEGLGPLEHQFSRRLGRPLTEAEHATLVARLRTHGPDRLGDVVLDLSRDELALWLVDPAAR
jgi:hypothetical protein